MLIVCDFFIFVLDASGAGCWCSPVCLILLCLNFLSSVIVTLLLPHCSLYRQGWGRWAHACDPVRLHHALGLFEHHPEEEPQPALPDGLWLQGKACVCGLCSRVKKKKRKGLQLFPCWSPKPDITDKTRRDMSQNNSYNNKQPSFIQETYTSREYFSTWRRDFRMSLTCPVNSKPLYRARLAVSICFLSLC